MMERLTETQSAGYDLKELNGEWCNKYCEKQKAYTCNECGIYQAIQKLAQYEYLEEQGLILRLPCKVGDTVWVITSPFNVFEGIEYNENLRDECYESFISSVTFYKNSVQYRINAKVTNHFISAYYYEQDFGKTIFLTRAEAEQKLKEMESESE